MRKMGFTFDFIRHEYKTLKELGYKFITCADYSINKTVLKGEKIIVNRVDIDFSVKKTERLLDIFNELDIKATFFLRLHAPEYNPFSFESYRIVKKILLTGHELGYHSEIVDQAFIWEESPEACLLRDIKSMETFYDMQVKGVASHGGNTGLNNLDFWSNRKPQEFGLLYEAYDKEPSFNLFQEAFYISDSEWTQWKTYDKGTLLQGDRRTPVEHLTGSGSPNLVHLLIHPDTYYDRHIYE